jgi:hypothetical protein
MAGTTHSLLLTHREVPAARNLFIAVVTEDP